MTNPNTPDRAPLPRVVVHDSNLVTAIQLIQAGTPEATFEGVATAGGDEYAFTMTARLYVILAAVDRGAIGVSRADVLASSTHEARVRLADAALRFFGIAPLFACAHCAEGTLDLRQEGDAPVLACDRCAFRVEIDPRLVSTLRGMR